MNDCVHTGDYEGQPESQLGRRKRGPWRPVRMHRATRLPTRLLTTLLVATLLASLLALGACGRGEPKAPEPPPKDVATLQREAEARALTEVAERQAEEERREAEERQGQEALLRLFGAVGDPPLPPVGTADAAAPGAGVVPFDEAVPPLPAEPTVRVAVFSPPAKPELAQRVALVLGTYERTYLEAQLGMAVKIAYVAQLKRPPTRASEIRYRPEFLRAAQSMATVLSSLEWIGPMSPDELRQDRVDVFVYLGERYR
jgi:hypothetical protein